MAKRKPSRKIIIKAQKKIAAAAASALIIVLAALGILYPPKEVKLTMPSEAANAAVKVHSIDVGQGDAALLEADGVFALIDTGDNSAQDEIMAYLKAAGADKLEYLIITHSHSDHIGNAAHIIEKLSVNKILLPQFNKAPLPTNTIFDSFLKAVEDNNLNAETMQAGGEYALGSAKIEILTDGIETDNQNNISPFIKFTGGGLSYLNSGDAEKEAEENALKSSADLSADIFKAAHHGSKTSNTNNLLLAVRPSAVAISCGADNSYGHPHKQALEAFGAVKAKMYITAETGNIIFYTDESGKLCAAMVK